jgi:hypothetical protein
VLLLITRIRRRLSSAHLVAALALAFAVAGGTALALPGKNNVDSGDIKNATVRGADVRNNSLTGADVKALTGADINEASLNIQLPTPPPSGVQSISTKLGPNQTASISSGSFTISETTDASGSCHLERITAREAGRYGEADLETPRLAEPQDPIAAGATEELDVLDVEGDYGQVWAMADDGGGGGTFSIVFDDVGGRCVFVATAVSA